MLAAVLTSHDLIASIHAIVRADREGKARVSFADRAANAAAAGFAAIGTTANDYLAVRASGLSDADIETILRDNGLVFGEIDSFPFWVHEGPPDDDFQNRLETAFHLAERFGQVHHAILPLGAGDPTLPPFDVMAARCREHAERADGLGLKMSIEFVPWGPLPDVNAAWTLAEAVDHPACGVNVDFWHHLAGAADESMLRKVPGNRIHSVHFTDGQPDLSEPNPLRRTQTQRRIPGDGVFPIVDTVRLLDDIGADIPYTVEVVSLPHRHLSPAEFATVLYDASRKVLDTARGDTTKAV
ncbi:MAG: sugar phosphate isomerase/epimerase [Acidobacteria bacterium]|nr:sugar phosphate isomerase/epimerase [Acidobacteriota bacterium]